MTVKTALWALQQAVFSRLDNDTGVKSVVTGVYDEVPQTARLPYIQIGDDTVNPYDTKTDNGEDCTLTLHCFSDGPGKTEAKQIMDLVLKSLTNSPLTIDPSFKCEGIQREFLNVFHDGLAYHGVCRFRIYIKQI
jgi:hypothetical protein